MITKNLARRLTQLETRLTPSDPRVLTITVTRIGKPDEIIEMHLPEPNGRPRPWPPRRNGGPLARE